MFSKILGLRRRLGIGGAYAPPAPSVWILATGFWNDGGKWDDSAVWID
jgi:hypothetical protein